MTIGVYLAVSLLSLASGIFLFFWGRHLWFESIDKVKSGEITGAFILFMGIVIGFCSVICIANVIDITLKIKL